MTNGLMMAALAVAPVLVLTAHMRDDGARSARTNMPTVTRTVWDSVYSVAQAARGETAYAKTCARCHGASLGGGDEATPLAGGGFLGNWNGLPLRDLQARIKTTMPSDTVGIYDRQLVTDVMAYLLKANGFPAGAAELPADPEALRDIVMKASRPEG